MYISKVYLPFFIVETILADVRGMQTAQQLRLLSDSTIKNKNTCSHTHTHTLAYPFKLINLSNQCY